MTNEDTKDVPETKPSSKRRLTEVHLIAARGRALRLFQTTSTVFPAEWASPVVIEQVMVDASEFAYHARRVIDLCGFRDRKFDEVGQTRFPVLPGQDIEFITDFHEAVNRLHHVRELVVNWAIIKGRRVWKNSPQDMVLSFARVETDIRPTANISLFGIAMAFLNSVIPAVQREFPDYQY